MLTDVLSCPRCGPEFGLILLADRIEDRRVLEGRLGCANCRERYAVRGGFGDLRPPRSGREPGAVEPEAGDAAFRLAALMGVSEGPGFSLVAGPSARLAAGVASVVPELEVVAVDPGLEGWPEERGVSRLAVEGRLPFHTGAMRAVALTGATVDGWLEEAARVLAADGRLVLMDAPADAEERLAAEGLGSVVSESGTIVASRS